MKKEIPIDSDKRNIPTVIRIFHIAMGPMTKRNPSTISEIPNAANKAIIIELSSI